MGGEPKVGEGKVVDPKTVETLSELATAFRQLRGSRSYTELDKAVNPSHRRGGPRVLPRSTLSNLLGGTSKSVPRRETVVSFLAACGLRDREQEPWLAAWERVSAAHLRRPAGAVRVREARARLLGVHAAIRVEGSSRDLPVYVPRDLDADVRTAVAAAADDGGLVLMVGGSSVGKTRTLLEAVQTVLPEWWLVHPTDTAELREFATTPTPRAVVWLDELQRYLDAAGGLPAGAVRSLITAGVVLVATLWPNEYATRIIKPAPGEPDPHADDRQILNLAHVMCVPDTFTASERGRAEALAVRDRRIRIALDTPGACRRPVTGQPVGGCARSI